MSYRKNLMKSAVVVALAMATLGGGAAVANAGQVTFSWSTPHGTFVIGPGHHERVVRHRAPVRVSPRHVRPYHDLQRHYLGPRQARRILRHAGFRNIHLLRDRRHTYLFEAQGRRGQRIVAVNKYNGEIIWRPRHRFHR